MSQRTAEEADLLAERGALLQEQEVLSSLKSNIDALYEAFFVAEQNPNEKVIIREFREACQTLQQSEIPPKFLPDILEALAKMQEKSETAEVKEALGDAMLSLESRA